MKTIIASLLLSTLFQPVALGQNVLSDREIQINGEIYGVIWCWAKQYGVNTPTELQRLIDKKASTRMATSYITAKVVLETGDKRQKNVFHNAMIGYMQENCPQYLQ